MSTSQGTPRITDNHRSYGGKEGILPSSLWKERGPADTWIPDFSPSRPGENKFLLFLATQVVVIH